MNRINDWLSIGRYRDTIDSELLHFHRIGAMLQLAEPVDQPGMDTLYLPVNDGEYLPHALLTEGIEFIKNHHSKHLLIACGAGISRSVTFGMVALKEIEGLSLLQAYQTIYTRHAQALPHLELLKSLCDYYDETEYESLWQLIYFQG